MENIKKVKVETPKGVRTLEFKKAQKFSPCAGECPIGVEKCIELRDPRDPENIGRCFMDFCGLEVYGLDEILKECIPIEGTVEKNLYDVLGIKEKGD